MKLSLNVNIACWSNISFENSLKRAIGDISRRLQSMQVFYQVNGDDQINMADFSGIDASIGS